MRTSAPSCVTRHLGGWAIDQEARNQEKKPKMSMVESFKFLVSQKYLGYLCILVYGLSINLTEVIWKKMVKQAHPNRKSKIFMGNYSSLVGAATFIIIFFGSNIVKHLGWRSAHSRPPCSWAAGCPLLCLCHHPGLQKQQKRAVDGGLCGHVAEHPVQGYQVCPI